MINSPGMTAVERNREPILQVLKTVIPEEARKLFEIGSGTGQHAIFMAPHFPKLQWTTSDLKLNHAEISETLDASRIPNVDGPIEFEVGKTVVPLECYDVIFSANTLHIMSEACVHLLIEHLGREVKPGGQVLFYGPFNYQGRFTSESNASFDRWLKSVDPKRGIRDFESVEQGMKAQGFELKNDFAMPANNRILQFFKIP